MSKNRFGRFNRSRFGDPLHNKKSGRNPMGDILPTSSSTSAVTGLFGGGKKSKKESKGDPVADLFDKAGQNLGLGNLGSKTEEIIEFITKPDAQVGGRIVRVGEFIQFLGIIQPELAELIPVGVTLETIGEIKSGKSGAELGKAVGGDIGSAIGGPFAQEVGSIIGGFIGQGILPDRQEQKVPETVAGDVQDQSNVGGAHGSTQHLEQDDRAKNNQQSADKEDHLNKAVVPGNLQSGVSQSVGDSLIENLKATNKQEFKQDLAEKGADNPQEILQFLLNNFASLEGLTTADRNSVLDDVLDSNVLNAFLT